MPEVLRPLVEQVVQASCLYYCSFVNRFLRIVRPSSQFQRIGRKVTVVVKADMATCLYRVIFGSVLFCALVVVQSSLSGLYVDNGLDQTVIQRGMTHRERMLVEHEILDLLGLPNRPRKTRNVPLNKSAPIFLLDVYKSLADEHDVRSTRSSEINLSGDDLHAIDQSDVIMTFQSKSKWRQFQINKIS